ncbi:PaaX family transcriptional regulator [Granulicoccus sp. GXG6511]|uniref:PaaX family transcriptional regulator n=1 Tax=Granulicoccus sp. GXG6511 TaxID=3381351 RepID=UPI003D7CD4E4
MTIADSVVEPTDAPAGPRNQHLIVSIFGLYARQRGGLLAVADLIRLLGDLGAEGAAVRSAVSRLKKRGLLASVRVDGVASYAMSDDLARILADGDSRIFEPRRAEVGDPWLLAAFSVPESERHLRHRIRTMLTKRGFGSVTPGLWIAPAWLFESAWNGLLDDGLEGYVHFFRAEPLGTADLAERVRNAWNLPALEALYREFVDAYEPVLAAWPAGGPEPSPLEAFRIFVPLVTEWRRLPYLDPGLPLAYLPDPWPGQVAADLFARLLARFEGPAAEHAGAVLR